MTRAGGISEIPVVSVLLAPLPAIVAMSAPCPVVATRFGGEVRSLVEASIVTSPDVMLYSARLIVTRSTSFDGWVVGVLVAMAAWLSAVSCRFFGKVGLIADWPYQLPVALDSIMEMVWLSLANEAVPGGGGASMNTSSWATTPPSPDSRE
ncbi:hypothetical protein D3C76_1333760 [compost metagenome]